MHTRTVTHVTRIPRFAEKSFADWARIGGKVNSQIPERMAVLFVFLRGERTAGSAGETQAMEFHVGQTLPGMEVDESERSDTARHQVKA